MIRLRNPPNMVGLIICLEMTSVSLRSHVRRVFFFVWGQIEGCEENERSEAENGSPALKSWSEAARRFRRHVA